MTTPAAVVFKTLAYKAESSYATLPGASGAQLLRYVQSPFALMKESYGSNEVRPDQQIYDLRHGMRKGQHRVSGELSCATYGDFFAAALRRDFAATSSITGASITIAGSGPTYTLSRAAGSYLTDGIKVGDIIRLTAGSFTAGNLNKNLLVTGVVALVLTVRVLNASTLTAEGPIASATVAVTGKRTYVPQSGHTDKSFTLEEWHSDKSVSEVWTGCKPVKFSVGLPSTGIATIGIDFMGNDVVTAGAQYFSSPTAATSTGLMQAVNGALLIAGTPVANITGLSFDIDSGYSGYPVVGKNTIPFLFAGPIKVTGKVTAFFDDTTLRDAFINETELDLLGVFSASNDAAAQFLSFVMPRIKLMSATKGENERAVTLDCDFQALVDGTGGSGQDTEKTTLVIQDSQL